MLARWRWFVVTGGVLALAGTPALVAALPTASSQLSAATLLARIKGSSAQAYAGYAEANGGLGLPVTRQFSSVADLFGGHTQLRVWSRGPSDWRLDTITLAGETDVHTDPLGSWTWDYESNVAIHTESPTAPAVRLPMAADLVPANLGRRLLSQADAGEVSRLPARRVAGRTASGLELRPAETASTIERVDVWAEPSSGVALRVDVFGKGDRNPALSTTFLDFSLATPAASDVAFLLPPGAAVRTDTQPDIAAAIDRLGRGSPPAQLAGMSRTPLLAGGSVGVYGRGVTTLAAVPLPARTLNSLRRQLLETPGVVSAAEGTSVAVGPLNLLLTTPDRDDISWLLTGTVTPAALRTAAAELRR